MIYKITGKMLRAYQLETVRKIVNKEYKHLLLVHPRRSGKSTTIFYLVNALINKYYIDTKMPINATIFAPQAKQCREIYIDNILDNGQKLISLANAKYLKSHLSLEYNFGSKIKFTGSDQIDNRVGAGNKIIVLDEYALSKPEAFQLLYPMIHATDGHMIVTSTPRGKNHLFDLYEEMQNKKDWLVLHSDVLQLGLMTQDEYDNLPMHPNYKAQEFLCSWESPFLNAVYLAPNQNKHKVKERVKIYGAIDLGISDATFIILAQEIDGKINCLKDFEFSGIALTDRINALKEYLKSLNYPLLDFTLFVPHDASIRNNDLVTTKEMIERMGVHCVSVRRQSIITNIEYMRSKWHNIFFNDDCKLAIEHLKAYTINQTTQLPNHDEHSHCADSLSYLILGLDKQKNNYVETSKYESYYKR